MGKNREILRFSAWDDSKRGIAARCVFWQCKRQI